MTLPPPATNPLASLFRAVREDLLLLALLHDRELDRETLLDLWRDGFEDFLGLRLQTPAALQALRLFRQGLSDIPTELDKGTLDILASEYADIYLNHTLNASPCESVWLDEDGLIMQEPMFQIRDWYRRFGLVVELSARGNNVEKLFHVAPSRTTTRSGSGPPRSRSNTLRT